ncbi:hypothetical protein CAPTEDRAFT_104220 [Capitella teleta]|uniref:Fibrinogen C-terminal domain-containing protein n=1 Tax=Capitella teleta TaxID=283909 RepID=R7TZT0_CAPTE|nr:hypothetical protein CAPTEDRAFT_104220 [Capitella teleta]|eukprot:ELT99259.1 hypothetical protein CAPTEDRAFT_104220 [Capitella teleta]
MQEILSLLSTNKTSHFTWNYSHLHALTTNLPYELRIDFKDHGDAVYAKYSSFNVDQSLMNSVWPLVANPGMLVSSQRTKRFDITTNYVSEESMDYHNGYRFSAKNQDHGTYLRDCANSNKGGWWYNHCHHAKLKGIYLNGAYNVSSIIVVLLLVA